MFCDFQRDYEKFTKYNHISIDKQRVNVYNIFCGIL
jgi:hypothetical protein